MTINILCNKVTSLITLFLVVTSINLRSQSNDQISTGQDPKGMATPSVDGARKSKALSFRYNVITAYDIKSESHLPGIEDATARVRRLNEFEVKMKIPVILKPQTKFIIGLKYQLEEYNFEDPSDLDNDINTNLEDKNLHVLAIDFNLLRSLNQSNYYMLRARLAVNGDYGEGDYPLTRYMKFMASGAYGWKLNSKNSLALGLSLNYTLGRPSIYPILVWNKTFNERWGFESVLPARFFLRHNVSDKTILVAGYLLDGNSYHITVDNPPLSEFQALELRRSDLMGKISLEQEIYDFLWFGVDVGYRYNINFDLSKDNSFNNEAILSNHVDPSFYFNISLFVVPPKKLATKYLKDSSIQ